MNMFEKRNAKLRKMTSLQQQMTWWLQLRKIARVAHSPFCPKDCSCQLGKVLDRTRYPTGVCKRIWSVWLVSCFQSRPKFSFVSFQTASCLQLLRHTPGRDEKLAEQGGSKIKWLPWLTKWKLWSTWRRGVDINWVTRFNGTSSPCLNFRWKIDNNEIESQVSSQYTFDKFCEQNGQPKNW